MNYTDNWLATQIIFTYRCFKYFYMFQFLCMFLFLWNVIYFMKNYIILHYALDFKYGDHSLFTGVSVTIYLHVVTLNLIRVQKKGAPATISQFAIGI